jgi:molybdopterin-guanine dinucleotide biosynthesis protein A
MINELYGLILAGGQSSRMGINKALISYHGKPHHEYLFELLTPFCKRVHTSCKSIHDFSKNFNPIPDLYDLNSPLNGIVSAIQTHSGKAWMTIPVDMPLVDANVIQFLIEHRDKEKMATCFYDSIGKAPEPLLTIWETKSHLSLLTYQKSGGISPKYFLQNQDVHLIKSPNPKYLININSAAELEAFRKSYM